MNGGEPELRIGRGRNYAVIVAHGPGQVVDETEPVGFELHPAPGAELPGGRFRLRFGDLVPEQGEGRPFGDFVAWSEGLWFDCCRGAVEVRVERAEDGQDGGWTAVARATVHVVPSKVGEDAWQAMRDDLLAISVELASDLIGRSSHGRRAGMGARSTINQLRAARRVLPRLGASLAAIASQPHSVLARRVPPEWGVPRSWDARTLALLARTGRDPRQAGVPRHALRVPDLRPQASLDVPEHRSMAACLEAVATAMSACAAKAGAEIAALEEDRAWRDQGAGDGRPTLYARHDRPRIERLQTIRAEAEALAGQACALRRMPPLDEVRAGHALQTPVFRHVPAYAAAFGAMCRWHSGGGLSVEEGAQTRGKDTARMYEQWVFLQLVAAVRQGGFVVEDENDLFRRINENRLVADLFRGASVRLRHPASRRLVTLTYEPWIRPRSDARAARDPFYRGRTGEAAWSPDVLMAFHGDDDADPPRSAIVFDAKYARSLSDHHWATTGKYLEIRSTAHDGPAVRQVWLICPGAPGIGLRDDAVAWTAHGPDRPPDEFLHGYARLAPDPDKPAGAPVEAARALVSGLLRSAGYL